MATVTTAKPKLDLRPGSHGRSDASFRMLTLAAGLAVMLILGLITLSTTVKSIPVFAHEGLKFFSGTVWNEQTQTFGALPFIYGTVVTAIIGILLATPIAIGIALFVTEYAPHRAKAPVVFVVDMLAAVPSVVWGLWGALILAPFFDPLFTSIAQGLKGVPVLDAFFAEPATGKCFLLAGLIVTIMILPIITSITREVFDTVPVDQKHSALALGMTRWEMIRATVFPHSRSGVVGAVMLGLGRAMGETIAVALVIGASAKITLNMFSAGDSMAATIANQWGEAGKGSLLQSALIALGVTLFVITILVNLAARWVVNRAEQHV